MNAADFDTLFAYSDASHAQLKDVLSCRESLFREPFPTTSRYDTIQKLLAHCIGAEERWITKRIRGESLPVIYEERASDTIEELFADARSVRTVTDDFRRSLDENSHRQMISVSLSESDTPLQLSVSDILFHILNHENFHRGQIITLLQQNGNDPPNFDYVFLKPVTRL